MRSRHAVRGGGWSWFDSHRACLPIQRQHQAINARADAQEGRVLLGAQVALLDAHCHCDGQCHRAGVAERFEGGEVVGHVEAERAEH